MLLLLPLIALAASTPDWVAPARRLSGEAKNVRKEMVEKIRAVAGLEKSLLAELGGPHRFLAYDVMTALELRTLLPEILEHLETDDTGFAVHAANSLSRAEDRMVLIQKYRKALESEKTAAPALMALLDTLGRLGALLTPDLCEKMLRHPSYEVREAALNYLRTAILRLGQQDWAIRVSPALESDQPWQIRVQALFLLSELPPRNRRSLASAFKKACAHLPDQEASRLCQALGKDASQ